MPGSSGLPMPGKAADVVKIGCDLNCCARCSASLMRTVVTGWVCR